MNHSWLLDTRKDAIKERSPYIVLRAKVHRTMTSGFQGTPYFKRCDRELVSKPAISLKRSWGGHRRMTLSLPTNLIHNVLVHRVVVVQRAEDQVRVRAMLTANGPPDVHLALAATKHPKHF